MIYFILFLIVYLVIGRIVAGVYSTSEFEDDVDSVGILFTLLWPLLVIVITSMCLWDWVITVTKPIPSPLFNLGRRIGQKLKERK